LLHPMVVRCRTVTLRRVKKRSALPVLVALLVGSASAGAATMLAKPLDLPIAGDGAVLSSSFTNIQRPPGPTRHTSTLPVTSSRATPAPTSPAPTTTPTTTSPPATTSPSTQPPSSTSSASPPAPPADDVDRVIALVNKERADAGCAALKVEPALTTAAVEHSDDMAARDYFSHTTPEGATFDERIKSAGYGLPGAENIAKGQKNAEQVMKDWMNSAGHRANILNCQLKTIGVALNTKGFYWTQDFGY
jgi:uncharacterized protein YkwD